MIIKSLLGRCLLEKRIDDKRNKTKFGRILDVQQLVKRYQNEIIAFNSSNLNLLRV